MRNNMMCLNKWWFIFSFIVFNLWGQQVFSEVKIQNWQTENGAKVLFVQAPEIPMLDVRVVFDAGSARDNGISGLASLTNSLLAEGAADLSSQQIAENFEAVGAQINYSIDRDMASVGVRSLTTKPEYLATALENLSKVLTQADFPEVAYLREHARMKIAIKSREQSPASIAAIAFNKAVFGSHPYATPVGGNLAGLEQMSRQKIVDFYKKYYVIKNATIAIVGNIKREQAQQLVDVLIRNLPIGEKPEALPVVKPLTEAKKIVIDFPSAQTHIFIGQPGVKRGDRDYFSLYVANHSFGGSGFASRLVDVIREKNGLAYSVYSYFSPLRELGSFTIGLQTKNKQTQKALNLLQDELKKYIENGPTEKELTASLNNVVGGFPLKTDSNSKLLGYITMIGFYNLPVDYLDKFIARIQAIDTTKIKKALKGRLDANKMVTVTVGKQ